MNWIDLSFTRTRQIGICSDSIVVGSDLTRLKVVHFLLDMDPPSNLVRRAKLVLLWTKVIPLLTKFPLNPQTNYFH